MKILPAFDRLQSKSREGAQILQNNQIATCKRISLAKVIKFLFALSQEITRYISYLDAPEQILIRSQTSQTSEYKDCINLELNEHT